MVLKILSMSSKNQNAIEIDIRDSKRYFVYIIRIEKSLEKYIKIGKSYLPGKTLILKRDQNKQNTAGNKFKYLKRIIMQNLSAMIY